MKKEQRPYQDNLEKFDKLYPKKDKYRCCACGYVQESERDIERNICPICDTVGRMCKVKEG